MYAATAVCRPPRRSRTSRQAARRTRRAWRSRRARSSATCSRTRTGRHLIETMLRRRSSRSPSTSRPLPRDGRARPRPGARASARGNVGIVELRNPRHLNAEDDTTIGAARERRSTSLLLDDQVEICVLRGGVVEHPRYAGRRIFGAGLNLTHLYRGQISYLFFPVRDLGLVHKVFRGLSEPPVEKLWIAAAETFAIGGGCQLLLTVDHILCRARHCRCTLPARNEGIIPGAANLRLPRFVGDRRARQAILSGSELAARGARGRDRRAGGDGRGASSARAADALQLRRGQRRRQPASAFRVGQEPLDVFREYMSVYCREQAVCYFSPALIRNLEENWRAHETPRLSAVGRAGAPDAARRAHPGRLATPLERPPVHRQGRPARALPARPARRPARRAAPHPRVLAARAASRPSSPTTQHDLDVWSEVMAYCMTMAGVKPGHGRPQRLRLRALHRRARLPPGRRAARRADDPGLRRRHRAPGAAAARPAGPGAVLHAVLRAAHRAGPARSRASARTSSTWRSACSAPSRGPRRCAPQLEAELGLTALNIYGLSEIVGPGVAAECPEARDGLHVMEDHFLVEVVDPETGAPRPRRHRRRARVHHADQGGDAAAALPHRRHRVAEPRAVRLRAHRSRA